jgi:Xaa-Pro aminopeptidase
VQNIDFAHRIEKVRARMEAQGLDVLVATKLGSRHYLAGALVPWRSAIVIPRRGDVILTTTSIDSERVAYDTWIKNVRPWELALRGPSMAEVVAQIISDGGFVSGVVGLETDDFTMNEHQELTRRLNVKLEDASSLVDSVMLIKEPAEIERMRRAAEVCDLAAEAVIKFIRPGVMETEIAGVVEQATRAAGSQWNWAVTGGTEVGSGYRQCFARGWSQPATTKRVQRGDIVTIDCHPLMDLYCGDHTFNVCVGKPTEEQQELAKVWREAIDTMLQNMKPGVVIADAARRTRKVIKDAGFDEFASSLLGHGLGTDSRMPPVVSEVNEMTFEENMFVELVVNIAVPRIGGMRTESMVLVTKDGPDLLTRTPLELISVEP